VDHPVDRGGSARHLAAHPRLDPGSGSERLCRVAVGVTIPAEGEVEALRDVEHRVPVGTAVLEQEDFVGRILRQAVGQDTSGRPRADDDVVEAHRGRPTFGAYNRLRRYIHETFEEGGMDDALYDYLPITQRPELEWPGGARLAFYVGLNVEHT